MALFHDFYYFSLTLQAMLSFFELFEGAQLFSWDRVGHSDLRQAETVRTAWNTALPVTLMHEVTFSQSCQESKDLKQQQLSENLNDARLKMLLQIITSVLVLEEMDHPARMADFCGAFLPKLKHHQDDDKQ